MKGGINFEEWKEIVKKNRRSLRSKSNSFKFEPESLTYGAEKAVKSPEYGQVHTITYNVTGMEIPSSWPTEIKSGKTLTLEITIPYGATSTVSTDIPYTYENGILTIPNIQTSPTITILATDALYENAKIGDYLYDDWTFGPTEKPGYLGKCVGLAENFHDGKSRWASSISSEDIRWANTQSGTVAVETGMERILDDKLSPWCGRANTNFLLNLDGSITYTAAEFCASKFDGLGYLPSVKELKLCVDNVPYFTAYSYWSSDEYTAGYAWTCHKSFNNQGGPSVAATTPKSDRAFCIAFMDLSGPCGKPVNNNGHEYVDLGLPSGTLWATMNVGASSETDYGNYYMYGMGSKTYDSTDTPYDGTEDPLDLTKDTARVVWGGDWHMPTKIQIEELTANTTYQWVTNYKGSGINGGTFTATNGAVLFIPAAGLWDYGGQYGVGSYGYYRGSSPNGSNNAYGLSFDSGFKGMYDSYRKDGYSVRPVIR